MFKCCLQNLDMSFLEAQEDTATTIGFQRDETPKSNLNHNILLWVLLLLSNESDFMESFEQQAQENQQSFEVCEELKYYRKSIDINQEKIVNNLWQCVFYIPVVNTKRIREIINNLA